MLLPLRLMLAVVTLPIRLIALLPLRLIAGLKLTVLAFLAGLGAGYAIHVKDVFDTWGRVRADIERDLPGDDLVPEPDLTDTRSLAIDAAADDIWPWIVQMGYGRGGFYGFGRVEDLRRPSTPAAETILEAFQELAVDDILPTHAGGGFRVAAIEPGRSLVLELDSAMVREQMAALADADDDDDDDGDDGPFGGDGGGSDMPDFRLGWAFVLEPEGDERTRLISRYRATVDVAGSKKAMALRIASYGLLAGLRRLMLGIKERAERPTDRAEAA